MRWWPVYARTHWRSLCVLPDPVAAMGPPTSRRKDGTKEDRGMRMREENGRGKGMEGEREERKGGGEKGVKEGEGRLAFRTILAPAVAVLF